MFRRKEKSPLDQLIAKAARELMLTQTNSTEFKAGVDQLAKLHVMRETESRNRVSPDVTATIIANLAGILLIISHERINVINSKAMGLLAHLRL